MQGKRVTNDENKLQDPGDYWQGEDGSWYGVCPDGQYCWLKNHTVVENADGTISVTPSILCGGGELKPKWHGYLTNGVWKEC